MPNNIWILVSGRNESSPSRYLPMMRWMTLATVLFVSSCFADENASYNKAGIIKQAEDNIRWLRQAKEQVERKERERNSLATLTDLMIKDSFDSQLMSKMDILYDNQTDLNKELKFVPQVFNCGKEFDIFKVLELAKAHRNITTEQPPCIVDVDDNMCTTKKGSGDKSNTNKMTKNTVAPQSKEAPGAVNAFAIRPGMTTRLPLGRQVEVEKRTESALVRQPSASPHKTSKLKQLNKEKPSSPQKEVSDKVVQNPPQKQFETKGIISRPKVAAYGKLIAEPSVDVIQNRENPHISEGQQQKWYAAQVEQNEQYSSIDENQNENDAQVKSQEPQASKLVALPESLQQQVNSPQLPMIQTVSQQTQAVGQPSPSQVIEQPHVQNVAMAEMAPQKQPDIEQTPSEVSEQRDRAGQGQVESFAMVHDEKNQEFDSKISDVTQTQQQVYKLSKEIPAQQSTIQPQLLEQQLQNSEKQTHHQSLEKQDQQQLQTEEQPRYQNLEKQNQQQFQTLDKLNQQQLQTPEQRQQQQQTAEQYKQQQIQTAEQQQFQTPEQQKQQLFQSAEQQKQKQLQTAEKDNSQLQSLEKHNQLLLQTIEKQHSAIIPAVGNSERQKTLMGTILGSEQQQGTQKTPYSANDQQQILKQQTLFSSRVEQNQQAAKPIANPIVQQAAAQLSDSQSVAKLPLEASNKGHLESNGDKLFNNNPDKTMMSAPINVMGTNPNMNSSFGNPTSKVNLVHGSIPATAYFWRNAMVNTPKIQNYDSLKTEQNKAAPVANKLENNYVPDNIQESPKEDYIYYQYQD
ncbi:unnamed protein product [Nezara viridula]|uniref:Uncharacterized protein n=1 Tax=Nezara viridula TaxID=85310 RepID=A0A9P0HMI2_NEZVI|nr:unnamed protein product [Nezara viridula]